MKSYRKTIHFVVAIAMLVGSQPVVLAQKPDQDIRLLEPPKNPGSSFGNREEIRRYRGEQLPLSDRIRADSIPLGMTYQVHILGEVQKPGTYRISASSRLSEALEKAEDILEQGSLRKIELRRGGKVRSIDLLSFKLLGNLDGNPYLLDNDVVYVPLRAKAVQIEGTVKRAGLYEIKDEKSLEDVLKFAGGFTPGIGNSASLQVIRYHGNEKTVFNVENTKESREKFLIENADVIFSPSILTANRKFDFNLSSLPGDNKLFYPSYEDRVFVLGAVAKPGPYYFSPYYGISQYLTLAGGTSKLSKSNKIEIISWNGERSKWTGQTIINPGDAIYVPEKYMAPESVVSLVLGIATSVLGISTTIFALTR